MCYRITKADYTREVTEASHKLVEAEEGETVPEVGVVCFLYNDA